jgi:hypothetical protein
MGDKNKASCFHTGNLVLSKQTLMQLLRLALQDHIFREEAGLLHVLDITEIRQDNKYDIKIALAIAKSNWFDDREAVRRGDLAR